MLLLLLLTTALHYELLSVIIGLPIIFAGILFTRALMPRYRIDNLIYLNWKILIFIIIISINILILIN